jgi:23S rRNA (cytosine1962-C5)-methyltransferase
MLKPKIVDAMPRYGQIPTTIFEDEDIVVVDKPAGWLTHEDGETNRPSITQWYSRPLGVHSRLDIDTTGVIAFSKTPNGHVRLSTAQRKHQLTKTYLAVLSEVPSPRSGRWIDQMPDGKRAELSYKTEHVSANFCVVSVRLFSGRTHQIRFQFSKHGYPILGDGRYGDAIDRQAPRTLLHSSSITLDDGHCVESSTPDDFSLALGLAPHRARTALVKSSHTDAYRLYNGLADGHEGWIVDRYGDYVWVRQNTGVPEGPMPKALGAYGLLAPKDRSRHTNPGAIHLSGQKAEDRIWVQENDVAYDVRFEGERSTGIFLDQRPQRAWLRKHAEGLEVLNTFAHSGAFSVAASVAGATSLNLDLSKKWLSRVSDQISENGGDPRHHPTIHGDVFEWLPRLHKQGRQFDLVILDPPSTSVGKKRKRWSAAKQYSELVALAAPLIKPGGRLWSSTNHRQTLPQTFAQRVNAGLPSGFKLERVCPQPVDHPTIGPAPLKVLVWRNTQGRKG